MASAEARKVAILRRQAAAERRASKQAASRQAAAESLAQAEQARRLANAKRVAELRAASEGPAARALREGRKVASAAWARLASGEVAADALAACLRCGSADHSSGEAIAALARSAGEADLADRADALATNSLIVDAAGLAVAQANSGRRNSAMHTIRHNRRFFGGDYSGILAAAEAAIIAAGDYGYIRFGDLLAATGAASGDLAEALAEPPEAQSAATGGDRRRIAGSSAGATDRRNC